MGKQSRNRTMKLCTRADRHRIGLRQRNQLLIRTGHRTKQGL